MSKTIVISGGAKGLGKAIALKFGEGGFNVAVCGRAIADLVLFEKEFKSQFANSEVLVFQADLKNEAEAKAFAAATMKKFGTINVLVNNAGTYVGGSICTEEAGILEHLIETNLYSAYYLTRALLPSMRDLQSGHIFNMCSVASILAYPNGGSYSISKFALLGFSKSLREELKNEGIKVTSLLPGATWSDSWAGVDLPADRIMPASDIAEVIWSAYHLSKTGVVEEIVIRPQLGDL